MTEFILYLVTVFVMGIINFILFSKLFDQNQSLSKSISKLENKKFIYRTGPTTYRELEFTLTGTKYNRDYYKGDKLGLEQYLGFIEEDIEELRSQVNSNKNLKELEKLKAIVAEVCDYVYGGKK
jgi:hypothetical protein